MSYGIAIVSGGLDSTTMIYHLLDEGHELDLVSFDYGQRHKKELTFVRVAAKQLGLRHDTVDLTDLTHLISNSALTSKDYLLGDGGSWDDKTKPAIEVPDGHYAEETMKATVVPNRNMIMLSIAAGIAVNRKANFIATGVHAGDHFIYPDCRPQFLHTCGMAIWDGNEGFHNFNYDAFGGAIRAPFVEKTKADIAYRALELGVPIHLTWSCYKGGENHCGRCGTCVERLEAIDEAVKHINHMPTDRYEEFVRKTDKQPGNRWDETIYDDNEFWKTAVKK